jgi:hypothetical protein
MAKNKYDYILIGSGIEALLKALELEREGLKGCLVEKEEMPGALYRGWKSGDTTFDSHLCYLPQTETMALAIRQLQIEIPELMSTPLDLGPLTFHNGHVQPFVGFGETTNEAVDLYSQFTPAQQLMLSHNTSSIVSLLKQKYQGDFLNLSEVTSLELQPEPTVVLNGATTLTATTLYCFESPLRLAKLLLHSKSSLPKNLVSKLSKTVLWTSVNLVYQHKQPVTQTQAMHILVGSKEQPCIGRFVFENEQPTSQWLSLVGPEVAADSELLGGTIREMKKQIKRMYPHFFDSVLKENITIAPESYGAVNPQLFENDSFPKAAGLKIGSRYYAGGAGLWGDLQSLFLKSQFASSEMAESTALT